MHIAFTPDINSSTYTLNEEESKHCIKVLRMKAGSELNLVDGRGTLYRAKILFDNPKACQLEIVTKQERFGGRPYFFHLAIAPVKNTDRLEWMVEKAVEIGIDRITPIICEHSERKQVNIERLNRVAIAAMKQSIKASLPVIDEEIAFKKFIQMPFEGQKFIAHCIDVPGNFPKFPLHSACNKNSPVLCLIGPEGDFSALEVDEAQKLGFTGVSLGNSRLRTETAGLVACHTVFLMNA